MFTTAETIEMTREYARWMGHPLNDWTDEEVLRLAMTWGMVPVVAVAVILDMDGSPVAATQH